MKLIKKVKYYLSWAGRREIRTRLYFFFRDKKADKRQKELFPQRYKITV